VRVDSRSSEDQGDQARPPGHDSQIAGTLRECREDLGLSIRALLGGGPGGRDALDKESFAKLPAISRALGPEAALTT
jgi:hypothetical protein